MRQQGGYWPPCALDMLRSAQLGRPREFSLPHNRRPIEFRLQHTGRHTRLLRMGRGSRATLPEARAQLAPAVPVVPVVPLRREVLPDLEGPARPSMLAGSRRSRPSRRGGSSRSTSELASWLLQPLLSPSVNLNGYGALCRWLVAVTLIECALAADLVVQPNHSGF